MRRVDENRRWDTRGVAKIFGVSRRRVKGWVERGLVHPASQRGSGYPLEFDLAGLIQAALVLRMQAVFGKKSKLVSLAPKMTPVILEGLEEVGLEMDATVGILHSPVDVWLMLTENDLRERVKQFVRREGRLFTLMALSPMLKTLFKWIEERG